MRTRIDDQIRSNQVRVIDQDGKQLGVMLTSEALKLAESASCNLVEISPNAEPPVAKIMQYDKYVFEQQKNRKAAATKQRKQGKTKEVKFRPSTDKGDYEVKLRNLRNFLEEGHKVKVTVWFRGREMTHQELGMQLLEKVRNDLALFSKVEFMPKLEGRQLMMILAPQKSSK
jgi:translation initiation factor IF-3